MIITTDFVGDNNDKLKEIQHEFWLYPGLDLEQGEKRISACFYIFHRAREVYLSEVGLQPLTFPELKAVHEFNDLIIESYSSFIVRSVLITDG